MPPSRSEPLFSGTHVAAFLVLWAAAQLAIALFQFPEVLAGGQLDGDGYIRLVRVEHLLTTGSWYDSVIPRSNWPYGEVIHWSRPLDLLMAALALPFMTFLSIEGAIAVAGGVVSALLHGLLCVSGVWVIAPVVSSPARFLVMPALLLQPGVFAYGTAGRADHHMLVLLLAFLAMGAWLRALLDPDDRTAPKVAGLLAGLALWVSPEALLPLAAIFAGGGIAWVLGGTRARASNVRFCASLALAVGAAILVERPPGAWMSVEFDRISVAHLSMALIALGFWSAVGRTGTRVVETPRRRAVVGMIAAVAGPVLLHVIHPGFFRGPAAHADPRLEEIFFPFVNELQPLLPTDLATTGLFVGHLGAALLALPYALYRVVRATSTGRRGAWAFLAAALALLVPMAAGQQRLAGYAGVTLALVVTSLLRDVMAWASSLRSTARARLARIGSMVVLLAGFPVLGSAISHAAASGRAVQLSEQAGQVDAPAACNLRALSRLLADPRELGDRPRTIATHPNMGPEILYRTPHRILSGPYHRNREGMTAILDLFTSTQTAQSRAIVQRREIDLLLLCPAVDRRYLGSARGGRELEDSQAGPSLYRQLAAGEPPAWLEEIELDDPQLAGFLLFAVR